MTRTSSVRRGRPAVTVSQILGWRPGAHGLATWPRVAAARRQSSRASTFCQRVPTWPRQASAGRRRVSRCRAVAVLTGWAAIVAGAATHAGASQPLRLHSTSSLHCLQLLLSAISRRQWHVHSRSRSSLTLTAWTRTRHVKVRSATESCFGIWISSGRLALRVVITSLHCCVVGWSARGECETNVAYMLATCMLSCNPRCQQASKTEQEWLPEGVSLVKKGHHPQQASWAGPVTVTIGYENRGSKGCAGGMKLPTPLAACASLCASESECNFFWVETPVSTKRHL